MVLIIFLGLSLFCITMRVIQGYKSYAEYRKIQEDIDNEGF